MTVWTIVLVYILIGLILGFVVEQLAKADVEIAELLGTDLRVRAAVVLGWPIVVIGVIIGMFNSGEEGPTPTGT